MLSVEPHPAASPDSGGLPYRAPTGSSRSVWFASARWGGSLMCSVVPVGVMPSECRSRARSYHVRCCARQAKRAPTHPAGLQRWTRRPAHPGGPAPCQRRRGSHWRRCPRRRLSRRGRTAPRGARGKEKRERPGVSVPPCRSYPMAAARMPRDARRVKACERRPGVRRCRYFSALTRNARSIGS